VGKAFRVFAPDQGSLAPPSRDDWLPAEHLARLIAVLVDEHLDLVRIRAAYTEGRGAPPCDPRLTSIQGGVESAFPVKPLEAGL
jgi:hypothetical protein